MTLNCVEKLISLGSIGVCGILALNKIKKSGGALRGQGQAIAGVVTGSVGSFLLVPIIIMAAMLFPELDQSRAKAQRALCASNEKQIAWPGSVT